MRQYFIRLAPLMALAFAALLPLGARAADPTYTVSGIHVDVTAESTSAAQAIAIDQGRPRAWSTLYRRLAKQADWAKQPQLDAQALRGLARGYTVSHERRSTTRYVADVTYIFSPEAVSRVLRGVSTNYGSPLARRILLIPMSPTFNRTSEWSTALLNPRFGGSQVPFTIPSGQSEMLRDLLACSSTRRTGPMSSLSPRASMRPKRCWCSPSRYLARFKSG